MADRFLYFAYGSNMLTRRLRAPNRAPSAQAVATGYLAGRRLTFDKESKDKETKDKERRKSGKCDARVTGKAGDRVYGVLFSIRTAELEALDKAEGAVGKNPGYKRSEVAVTAVDGSAQTALTYVALRSDPSVRPYHWYKAFVVAGAVEHGLPPAYVEWLRTFESQRDDDADRRAENEAILFET